MPASAAITSIETFGPSLRMTRTAASSNSARRVEVVATTMLRRVTLPTVTVKGLFVGIGGLAQERGQRGAPCVTGGVEAEAGGAEVEVGSSGLSDDHGRHARPLCKGGHGGGIGGGDDGARRALGEQRDGVGDVDPDAAVPRDRHLGEAYP